MTADDCYQLGVQLHKNENYQYAIMWLHEALHRINDSEVIDENLEESINGYLALSYVESGRSHFFSIFNCHFDHFFFCVSGNLTYASSLVKRILSTNPESEFAPIEAAIKSQMEEQKFHSDTVQDTKSTSEVFLLQCNIDYNLSFYIFRRTKKLWKR